MGEGFTKGAGEGGGKVGAEKDGKMEGKRRHMGENTIMKYKGWNTYCGDYDSFP